MRTLWQRDQPGEGGRGQRQVDWCLGLLLENRPSTMATLTQSRGAHERRKGRERDELGHSYSHVLPPFQTLSMSKSSLKAIQHLIRSKGKPPQLAPCALVKRGSTKGGDFFF